MKTKSNIWQRKAAAEGKLTASIKYLQFVGGRAVNSEQELCSACVLWFDRVFPGRKFDLIHIPNEGTKSKVRGAILKSMGVRAGVPDYIVCCSGQFIGWIEFKFGNNKLDSEQIKFRNLCRNNSVNWAEVRSFEQFKDVLHKWGVYDPKRDRIPIFVPDKIKKDGEVLDISKIFKR